jgi:drug/metabolite transporter (DMT)-like permease
MHWVAASLMSALFLGFYDLCNKRSFRENAVLPCIFFANVCAAAIWAGAMAWQALQPGSLPPSFSVRSLSLAGHGLVWVKTLIVSASWICSYFAVKHLTVSLAAPVRATAPMWTLLGAVLFLGERLSALELLGIALVLGSLVALSFVGREEGVHFHRDKWIAWLAAGTLLGSVSSLYDKHLFGTVGLDVATVQAWFSIDLSLAFLPLALGWKLRWWPRHEFHWRWSIPCSALALLVADFVYFGALRDPEARIAIVSCLRRGSTLVAFAGGVFLFRETNGLRKLPAVLGVLAGIVLTLLGKGAAPSKPVGDPSHHLPGGGEAERAGDEGGGAEAPVAVQPQ